MSFQQVVHSIHPVAHQKVVEEFGLAKLTARDDLFDKGRAPEGLQLARDRIVKLEPGAVALDVRVVLIEEERIFKRGLAPVPAE